jgi:hypothetical protein
MVHLYQDNPVGGANQLNSLLDVNISNPENKQIIYYDSTTGTWRNYNPPFVDHDDILHTIEECTASTDLNDVAGAAVASALNSKMPHTYSKSVTNASISQTWGSWYYATVEISTNGKDCRGLRMFASYVQTSGGSALAYISDVSSTVITVMLVRPASATSSGNLYVDVYD